MSFGYRVRTYRESDRENATILFEKCNVAFRTKAPASEFIDYMRRARSAEIDRLGVYFSERGGMFWVVTNGPNLIGMLGLEPSGSGRMELRRLYVDPGLQAAGLGGQLLAYGERAAIRMGATQLCLSTSAYQDRAVHLYRKNGYELRPDQRPRNPTRGLNTGQPRLTGTKLLSPELFPDISNLTDEGFCHV